MDTLALLERYRLRLINLSQHNRSLRLLRTYPRQDVDVPDLSYSPTVEGGPAGLLNQFFSGRSVRLLRAIDRTDSRLATLDRNLTLLHRELQQRQAETGAYDLAIGYPFVEGRFAAGAVARCPLVLFPAVLTRQRGQGTQTGWQLQLVKDAEIQLNPTFFRAYEKYGGGALSATFWEEAQLTRPATLQAFLNELFALLKRHGIGVQMPSRLFLQRVEPLRSYSELELQQRPQGQLSLVENAVLGLFPQSDTALLNDYNSLLATPTSHEAFPIATLVGTPPPRRIYPLPPPAKRWYPLPVDSSQEQVLAALAGGADVAVDGPPGTGKSQLIVNAAAAALAAGGRVLIVSEKRAALEVVRTRLSHIGLSPWVYQLHDATTDKAPTYRQLAHLLAQLESQSAEPASHNLVRWEDLSRHIQHLQAPLVAYLDALRAPLACGYTPAELYQRLLSAGRGLGSKHLDSVVQAANHLTRVQLTDALHKLRTIARYPEFLDVTHPWHSRLPTSTWGPEAQSAFVAFLQTLPAAVHTQRTGFATWASKLGLPVARFFWYDEDAFSKDATSFQALVQKVESDLELHGYALQLGPAALEGWAREAETWQVRLTAHRYVVPAANPGTLVALIEAYGAARAQPYAWLKRRTYRARKAMRDRLPGMRLTPAFLVALKAEAATWRSYEAWVAQLPGSVRPSDESLLTEVAIRWRQAAEAVAALQRERLFPLLDSSLDETALAGVRASVAQLAEVLDAWQLVRRSWAEYLPPDKCELLEMAVVEGRSIDLLLATWVQAYANNAVLLTELDRLLLALSPAEKLLLQATAPAIVAGDEAWQTTLTQQVESAWLSAAEEARPALLLPLQRTFEPTVTELQARAEEQRLEAAAQLPRLLQVLARQALATEGNAQAVAELRYQLQKQRRLWPLRRLMGHFWREGLAHLMPVVLASPEAVATVFPLEAGLFDLVVIDEASQCRVEAALPVLIRGKQRLVAGDDKQLPPFDVFRAIPESGYEDSSLATDAESILALARAQFQQGSLRWHYRSSDPRLVAFSNQHFYNGQLRVVRSPHPTGTPFELHRVNGVWEGQHNAAEAEAVVLALEAELLANPTYSLGVVTFNYRQQEAIWDAVDSRLETLQSGTGKDQADLVARWRAVLAGETGEPLFVRNLENVQGDERDTIVFSIGYARDKEGKLHHRFGLLNQVGGENRLNVAVTRARQRAVVVTSVHAAELRVEASEHAGPKRLRDYLAFVEAQVQGSSDTSSVQATQVEPPPTWLQPTAAVLDGSGLVGVYLSETTTEALHLVGQVAATASVWADFVYLPALLQTKGWLYRPVHLPVAVRSMPQR